MIQYDTMPNTLLSPWGIFSWTIITAVRCQTLWKYKILNKVNTNYDHARTNFSVVSEILCYFVLHKDRRPGFTKLTFSTWHILTDIY